MKSKKTNEFLINADKRIPHKSIDTEIELPLELVGRFEHYPENRRRSVNKILFKNDFFNLTYSMNTKELTISSRGDIVYSAIPYDTARKYIQSASIQYLLNPKESRQYIESHKVNLEKYIKLSIFQVTGKRVKKNSVLVKRAYNEIFENPLFEIQILGRLMQHDETGPISANIAGKFLFSENVNTGISAYISEYINFVIQLTESLPITTDGKSVKLLETNLVKRFIANNSTKDKFLTHKSALSLIPQKVKTSLENSEGNASQSLTLKDMPILRSSRGEEITKARKNYIPHSVHPKETEKYFENVHSIENRNLLNVVS